MDLKGLNMLTGVNFEQFITPRDEFYAAKLFYVVFYARYHNKHYLASMNSGGKLNFLGSGSDLN